MPILNVCVTYYVFSHVRCVCPLSHLTHSIILACTQKRQHISLCSFYYFKIVKLKFVISVAFLVCVHGTLMQNLRLILKTGLKKMGRNHVHFASGLPRENGVISGKYALLW